ncbi:hypothetical protein F4780DRAFT_757085 [Xylariomycetidae sp. FL0641]|nr:hypothetical protein F4780DRAFT_757085 [Xylariomycetidae sp. FL0641]
MGVPMMTVMLPIRNERHSAKRGYPGRAESVRRGAVRYVRSVYQVIGATSTAYFTYYLRKPSTRSRNPKKKRRFCSSSYMKESETSALPWPVLFLLSLFPPLPPALLLCLATYM